MKATDKQIDNLVSLLDGYVEKRGHHLTPPSGNRCWQTKRASAKMMP